MTKEEKAQIKEEKKNSKKNALMMFVIVVVVDPFHHLLYYHLNHLHLFIHHLILSSLPQSMKMYWSYHRYYSIFAQQMIPIDKALKECALQIILLCSRVLPMIIKKGYMDILKEKIINEPF